MIADSENFHNRTGIYKKVLHDDVTLVPSYQPKDVNFCYKLGKGVEVQKFDAQQQPKLSWYESTARRELFVKRNLDKGNIAKVENILGCPEESKRAKYLEEDRAGWDCPHCRCPQSCHQENYGAILDTDF